MSRLADDLMLVSEAAATLVVLYGYDDEDAIDLVTWVLNDPHAPAEPPEERLAVFLRAMFVLWPWPTLSGILNGDDGRPVERVPILGSVL